MPCTLTVVFHPIGSQPTKIFNGPIEDAECEQIKALSPNVTITQMLTMPLRTPGSATWKDFACDMFFPLTSNIELIKIRNRWIKLSSIQTGIDIKTPLIEKIFFKTFFVACDLLTLVIRIVTCIPRTYFNPIRHPIKDLLIKKHVSSDQVNSLDRVFILIRDNPPPAKPMVSEYFSLNTRPLRVITL